MNKKSQSSRFWYICGPLFLYWIIQFIGQFIGEFMVVLPHMGELMDYGEITTSMTTEQMWEFMNRSMQKVYEILVQYSLPILAFATVCTLPLSITLFCRDRKEERWGVENTKVTPKLWKYGLVVVLGIVFSLGMNCLITMIDLAFFVESFSGVTSTIEPNILMEVICAGVLIPIGEEFMFRGVLFKRYRRSNTFLLAATLSSLIYGLTQGNMIQFAYAYVFGVFLCYIYENVGTLKSTILFHITSNLFGVILSYSSLGGWLIQDPIRIAAAIVISVFVISSIYVFVQNIENKNKGV